MSRGASDTEKVTLLMHCTGQWDSLTWSHLAMDWWAAFKVWTDNSYWHLSDGEMQRACGLEIPKFPLSFYLFLKHIDSWSWRSWTMMLFWRFMGVECVRISSKLIVNSTAEWTLLDLEIPCVHVIHHHRRVPAFVFHLQEAACIAFSLLFNINHFLI